MGFDPVSFAIGAGVGAAAGAGGVYVLKGRLGGKGASPEDSEKPAETLGAAREFLSPQSNRRYTLAMQQFFRHRHLPGTQLDLTEVLVEPRLLQGRAPVLTIEEDEAGILIETDLYRVIPMLHQFPAIYGSFQMETLSLQDLETGNRHIALLGIPGSGKSTALAVLGLIALGAISLDDFRTKDRLVFDEEEDANLSEDMRDRRRREREDVQLRAIRQLRELQQREEEAEALAQRDDEVALDRLFPIYAHVHDIDLNPAAYGGTIDPAEPIVRALFKYVNRTTAVVSTPLVYRMLTDSQALVLIDGFDELTPQEQAPYITWLASLREFYSGNFIIVTGPAVGYDTLLNSGFAPAFIAPLNQLKVDEYIQKWVEAWQKVGSLPDENDLKSLVVDNRNRTVLDLTMKLWATLQGSIHETGRRGYYESYVRQQVGDIQYAVEVLQGIAAYWLDQGVLPTGETLQQVVAHQMGLTVEVAEEPIEEVEDTKKGRKKDKGQDKALSETATQVKKVLDQLMSSSLVHMLPNGAIGLCHPVIGWYLAGETLQNAAPPDLAKLAANPNWHGALTFATAIVDVEPTVLAKVMGQPDLLFSNMFSVVDWMPDVTHNLRWKTEVLKRLGAALLAPNQFPAMREYAVAALVSARDDSGGVVHILRQAIRSGNADLRRMGCIGLGAMGVTKAIADLTPMLYDEVSEVQLAAGLALGAIGTEEALTAMTEALLSGDRNLRKIVAESFAAMPGDGHAVLYDGISHQDLEVRRACAYGLARIPQTWALIALYRAMLEDSQWAVREAAKQAFAHAREPKRMGPQLYPEPVEYQWLVDWAAKRGEPVPEGTAGRQVLMAALQNAPGRVRVEAAKALGSLSHVTAVKVLYQTLTDADALVRVAAFDALGRMSNRIGRPMPGVG